MPDLLSAALTPVVQVLEAMGVVCYVGGSVAAMTHGEYRETADVDVIAQLQDQHVTRFVQSLADEYYVDEDMIRDAVEQTSSFKIMHLDSMFKVDVFLLKRRPYDREVAQRRTRQAIETEPPVDAYVATAEDILLAKLEWFRMGGEVSDRQ